MNRVLLRRLLVSSLMLVIAGAGFPSGSPADTAGSPFSVKPTATTKECRGVSHCVGVTGPWVVVPARGEATYLLRCPDPHGYTVGGTDARASSSSVQIWFDGQLGAPIGTPSFQTSTGAALLFHATTINGRPGSFAPILGCVSLKQVSSRSTVSASLIAGLPGTAASPPLDLHAATVQLLPHVIYPPQRVTCRANEKLVGRWHALAYLSGPPDLSHIHGLRLHSIVKGDELLVSYITTESSLFDTVGPYPEVQIGVMCKPRAGP